MGNRCSKTNFSSPSNKGQRNASNDPEQTPPSSATSTKPQRMLNKCISLCKDNVKSANDVDVLIDGIKELLERHKHKQHKPETATSSSADLESEKGSNLPTSLVKSGSKFLKILNENTEKISKEGDFSIEDFISGEGAKIASDMLQQLGKLHWIVGGLSMIAYLLDKFGKVSDNRAECLEMLQYLIDLAGHVKNLKDSIPEKEENLRNVLLVIMEGSMMCATQLKDKKLFSFMKTSVNSEALTSLREKIKLLYPDLILTAVTAIIQQRPAFLPIAQPVYPSGAVGIDERVKEVVKLLTRDESSSAVILWGVGGIGKTTLATAVLSNIKISDCCYTNVYINEDPSRNDFKSMQLQILEDVFPDYVHGKQIKLRNCTDGRDQLAKAFQGKTDKPILLFIDNALRAEDLKELLPKDLGGLPRGSKILVTTRQLAVTDMFEQRGLSRCGFPVKILPNKDALNILCKDPTKLDYIKDDVDRILRICNGIPLVLTIVGSHLRQQKYRADDYRQLLETLEKGEDIKNPNVEEEDIKNSSLRERLVSFVYKKLEPSAQEAFLDICYFFDNWTRRHVEYIVGKAEFTSLVEASFITTDALNDRGEEKLIVHDLVRAQGRRMSDSTRITDLRSLNQAIQDNRLTEIKGVWLIEDKSPYMIEERQLNSMRKSLRVLALGERMTVSGRSQETYKELRFLQLGGDIPSIPLNLEALDRLAVFYGPIFKEGVSVNRLPNNLLVMKAMKQSELKECTNSSESKSMQAVQNCSLIELNLEKLSNVQKVPKWFHQLNALEILILDGWYKSEELPEQVCGLPKLTTLSLKGWGQLKHLPQSLSRLTTLTDLDISDCYQLEDFPSGQFTNLKRINVTGCSVVLQKKIDKTFENVTVIRFEIHSLDWLDDD